MTQDYAVGTCPACNGTKRKLATYTDCAIDVVFDYDKTTGTVPCSNCGGQYMSGLATGVVRLNKDGIPCAHAYAKTGPEDREPYGWREYTCRNCGDQYVIDSGD
jgi:hypothetical protein